MQRAELAAFVSRHAFAASREHPLSRWGGCEAPGPRPEGLQFEYRFDEDERFAWSRYPGAVRQAGVLTPYPTLSLAPPAGGPGRRAPVPDRMRNPRMPAGLSACLQRRSFVITRMNLLRTVPKASP